MDTARIDDMRVADSAVRKVIGGESGHRMIEAVSNRIDELRRLVLGFDGYGSCDWDDVESYIHEVSDADSAFPYTFDRMQSIAESIHHATHEPEFGSYDSGSIVDMAGMILQDIMYNALNIIAHDIASESLA